MELSDRDFLNWRVHLASQAVNALLMKSNQDIENEHQRKNLAWQAVSVADAVLSEIGIEIDDES